MVRRSGDEGDRWKSKSECREPDHQGATRFARRRVIRTFASVRAVAPQIFRNLLRVRSIAEKPYVYWVFHAFRFSPFCANSRQYCILKCNPLILFTFWGAESPDPDNLEDQRSRYSCQWQQREKVRRRRSAPRRRRRRVAGRRNKSCM